MYLAHRRGGRMNDRAQRRISPVSDRRHAAAVGRQLLLDGSQRNPRSSRRLGTAALRHEPGPVEVRNTAALDRNDAGRARHFHIRVSRQVAIQIPTESAQHGIRRAGERPVELAAANRGIDIARLAGLDAHDARRGKLEPPQIGGSARRRSRKARRNPRPKRPRHGCRSDRSNRGKAATSHHGYRPECRPYPHARRRRSRSRSEASVRVVRRSRPRRGSRRNGSAARRKRRKPKLP